MPSSIEHGNTTKPNSVCSTAEADPTGVYGTSPEA